MSGSRIAFEVDGLSKTFGATKALRDVDLVVHASEIHGLVGGNGAGKSTLLKIVTGVHRADAGAIRLMGEPYAPATPREALARGVALIPQELRVVPDMSVADNVMLGHWPATRLPVLGAIPMVDRAAAARMASEHLKSLGLAIDPKRRLRDLSFAERQSVVIARAVGLDAKVLILDEPTAALATHEVQGLFALIGRLRDQGVTIVYVSHRLEEIETLCDRVTVLRDGRVSARLTRRFFTRAELTAAITGAETFARARVERVDPERAPFLQADCPGVDGRVSLALRPGRIVGLHGLLGSGIGDLLRSLFGARGARAVRLDAADVVLATPRAAIDRGIGYVPSERAQAIVPTLSVRDNILLPHLDRFSRGGRLRGGMMDAVAARLMSALDIRPRDATLPAGALSGGNQQKLLFARWMVGATRALLLDEPTHGIDVGAKALIEERIETFAREGGAVLLHSVERADLVALADELRVMMAGRLSGPIDPRLDRAAEGAAA